MHFGGLPKSLGAVVGCYHHKALGSQASAEGGGEAKLVLNQQDTHLPPHLRPQAF